MFDYLQPHDGPVIKGLEQFETIYAKGQPQYRPLRTLPSEDGKGAISRFSLTDTQRQAIAEGADLYLELLHFGGHLAPSRMMILTPPPEETEAAARFCSWWKAQTKGPYQIGKPEQTPAEETHRCGSRDSNALADRQFPGPDTWRMVGQDRVCSFCGSLHPEDFEALLDEAGKPDGQAEVSGTDKAYKMYARRAEVQNAEQGGIKFYVWHAPDQSFIARVNEKARLAIRESHDRAQKRYSERYRETESATSTAAEA